MAELPAIIRILALCSVLALSACSRTAIVDAPSSNVPALSPTAGTGPAGWWDIRFRLRWNADQQPDWHLDALLADRICSPVLAAAESQIGLWRFHRRAAHDAAGHQFRLSIYTDSPTAHSIYTQIHNDPFLRSLTADGQIMTLQMDKVDDPTRPSLSQTSDPGWPPEIQTSWPYFIMGVSRMWLKLIDAVRASSPLPTRTDLASVLDEYRAINDRVNALWRDEGQHAYLHHLNALFGYQPLVIRETNLKRF